VQSLEIALRGKHGVRTVLLNADVVEFGAEQCLLTASVDITDRKTVEAALIQSEQRYRAVVDNANDIVSTMDLEFRFTSVNPAVERILGYTREEIVGIPLQRFIPQDQLPMHLQVLQRKLQGALATVAPGQPGRFACARRMRSANTERAAGERSTVPEWLASHGRYRTRR
jgi:PAS domain-containing protein